MSLYPSRQLGGDILAMVSATSSIAAWQQQLDWVLRIVASILAIAAGIYSIVIRYRKRQ